MLEDETFRMGEALRREMIGEPETTMQTGKLQGWVKLFREKEIEHLWAPYWTRTELLDRKSRAVCALTCLVMLGYEEDLSVLIRGLVKNKILTRIEIREVIMHCPGYIGYPKTLGARKVAQQVFNEKDL